MLTIFSTCKPFIDEFDIIQTNAIKSWTQLGDDIEIILFGDEKGVSNIAKKLSIKHIDSVKRNKFGTPYLDYMFSEAAKTTRSKVLCYVNADIIFLPGVIEVIKFIESKFDKFLIVGRRWEVEIKEPIDCSTQNWHVNLKKYTTRNGKLSISSAIDYFIFTKDLYKNIPEFLIGRTAWDNYLMGSAILKTLYVFDATDVIFAIHQNHSYKHHKQADYGVWKGEEAEHNKKLQGKKYLQSSLGNIKKAFFKIKRGDNAFKIEPNVSGMIKSVFSYIKGLGIK